MPHTKDFVIDAQHACPPQDRWGREGLEQFQASLLSRMAASNHESLHTRRLAVAMEGQRCLVPLTQAGEIVPLVGHAITPVPATRPWFRGLLNIRGNLIGLADLMGLAGAPLQLVGTASHALLLAPGVAPQCGLLVSAVLGLRDISEMVRISKNDDEGIRILGANQRYKDSSGQQWDELDLVQMSQDSSFLEVGR
ncbi:twitching motility protein [Herbaspirillum frisingense GSF30]|uniref:Twitching motility protein n=1 Tax=Herbaspirillum frisingense GSF30 TaxID=864073 RepID=A0AAI9N538_9BURK|nr:chemotaxis protein CheW [Herbaspirillum frisingense]EOA05994.1 twitching motility protein [Herbaspirillum frisingense GSF30]